MIRGSTATPGSAAGRGLKAVASLQTGEITEGELIVSTGDHDEGIRAVAPDILCLVAGIGPGQRAQRHQPRHETHVGVRFASPGTTSRSPSTKQRPNEQGYVAWDAFETNYLLADPCRSR